MINGHITVFKFLKKKVNLFEKKIKKKFNGLTRVLYGHSVNSNLTESTKLNLFRRLKYQIEHS